MPLPVWAAAAAAAALKEFAEEGGGAAGRGLVGAAGRGLCNAHANNPGIVGSLGPLATDFVNGACAPYYNEYGITPPVVGLPEFRGGQCVGIQYAVNLQWFNGSVMGDAGVILHGPILGVVTEPSSTPDYLRAGARGHNNEGEEVNAFAGIVRTEFADTVRITSVEPLYGEPDDCGDPVPPPSVPSPNAPAGDYGEPFPGEDYSGRPAPIVVFAPSLNPDGTLSIPVTIDGDPFDLGTPPPGGGRPEDGKPLQNGPTQEPDPESNGKVCFPELGGYECVGVQWFLGVPESLGVIPSSAAFVPIYPRVIGNIRLLLGACDSILGFVEDQVQIRTSKGCVFRSVGGTKVSGAIINTLPGINSYLTPLYVEVEGE